MSLFVRPWVTTILGSAASSTACRFELASLMMMSFGVFSVHKGAASGKSSWKSKRTGTI